MSYKYIYACSLPMDPAGSFQHLSFYPRARIRGSHRVQAEWRQCTSARILTVSARLSVLNSVGPLTLRSARLVVGWLVGWLVGCSTGFRAGLSQCTVGHRPSRTQKARICLQDSFMIWIYKATKKGHTQTQRKANRTLHEGCQAPRFMA